MADNVEQSSKVDNEELNEDLTVAASDIEVQEIENTEETEVEVEDGDDIKKEDETEEKSSKENKKEKKHKKDKKDTIIEELNDKYLRTFAEFDNYRKRTEKEKSAMFEVGAKSVVEKILPIVDNFERGLATVPEEEKGSPFAEGMDKIYKQLITSLEEIDVKAIEAVGAAFDPELHNAVMHVEDEEVGENTIVEEFQKGYTYRDSVVRHSMVKVAN